MVAHQQWEGKHPPGKKWEREEDMSSESSGLGCEEYVVLDKDHQTGRAGDEADNFISN